MNRHGRRFIELRNFKSHAKSLNVKRLKDDELEFYEQHCLLPPAVICHQPSVHLVAVTQRRNGWPVENPEDLEPPEALRRLQRPHTDGLHPFDAEREHNPLLLTPDCTTFEPWDADNKVMLTAPHGRTVQRGTVERYDDQRGRWVLGPGAPRRGGEGRSVGLPRPLLSCLGHKGAHNS